MTGENSAPAKSASEGIITTESLQAGGRGRREERREGQAGVSPAHEEARPERRRPDAATAHRRMARPNAVNKTACRVRNWSGTATGWGFAVAASDQRACMERTRNATKANLGRRDLGQGGGGG